jgi:hypothetical protein
MVVKFSTVGSKPERGRGLIYFTTEYMGNPSDDIFPEPTAPSAVRGY